MTTETTTNSTVNWTIDELGAQVALALSRDYDGQPNGQVSDIPNRRTIRYYTTLGLLDRPAKMRGRTGLYGRRHLLQIVAIKRLQLRSLTLAEIQGVLTGISSSKLEEIAAVPDDEPTAAFGATEDDVDELNEPARSREPFWLSEPAPLHETESERHDSDAPVAESATLDIGKAAEPASKLLPGIRLAPSVVLLVEAERQLYADDLAAIEAAAGPLLKLLQQRGLTVAPAKRREP